MTVGELKKILEELPDNMMVTAYYAGDMTLDWKSNHSPKPPRPYLMRWNSERGIMEIDLMP